MSHEPVLPIPRVRDGDYAHCVECCEAIEEVVGLWRHVRTGVDPVWTAEELLGELSRGVVERRQGLVLLQVDDDVWDEIERRYG